MSTSNTAMTAIIAHEATGTIYRMAEDHDSTPTATWIERFKGNCWQWESMTTEPFAEVVRDYNGKGYVCLAIED
jgi:hypothetical protein